MRSLLSLDDAGKRHPNVLRDELDGRLRHGPMAFRLLLQLANEGDPTDDVTALWPEGRPLVELGGLEITGISPTSAADERRLIFDPSNRTDGIDLVRSDPAGPIGGVRDLVRPAQQGGVIIRDSRGPRQD